MQTVTWERIEDWLLSLTGNDAFSTDEKAWIKSAVNRRIRMAYEESPFWPRYINEELRWAGFDNVVPVDQEGKSSIDTLLGTWDSDPRKRISTAQRYESVPRSDGFQLLGLADGTNEDPYVEWRWDGSSLSESSGKTSELDSTTYRAVSMWVRINQDTYTDSPSGSPVIIRSNQLLQTNIGGGLLSPIFEIYAQTTGNDLVVGESSSIGSFQVYENGTLLAGSGVATIETGEVVSNTGWRFFTFTQPTSDPTTYKLNNIIVGSDTSTTRTIDSLDIADVRFYANSLTASEIVEAYENPLLIQDGVVWASSLPQFWCSYKAQLTAYYGDGTGETSTVPVEFQEYAVHGAYADWLRMEGQNGKALAEEQFARESLERQLERIYYTSGSPLISSNWNTHSKSQSR